MKKDEGRLRVIQNIKNAIEANELNRKVEEGDHVVTEEDRRTTIIGFDILKKKPGNYTKAEIARHMADKITSQINVDTEIIGFENIKNIKTSAIITCNHFSKFDNTVVRHCLIKLRKTKNFYIIVQETNMFMPGQLGWLLKNCYTIPISTNIEYNTNNFVPALNKIMDENNFLLIYPEKEMWYNYRKPRPMKIGAYHYACKYNVPIIPFFIEIINRDEIDEDGFYRLKYRLHIMEPIYPDKTKNFKDRKEEMREKDYSARLKKYEEVYNRKFEKEFDIEKDIAGWVK